jgi:hypothetical protein
MSPPERPKGEEHQSAQREGIPVTPPGHPEAKNIEVRSTEGLQ